MVGQDICGNCGGAFRKAKAPHRFCSRRCQRDALARQDRLARILYRAVLGILGPEIASRTPCGGAGRAYSMPDGGHWQPGGVESQRTGEAMAAPEPNPACVPDDPIPEHIGPAGIDRIIAAYQHRREAGYPQIARALDGSENHGVVSVEARPRQTAEKQR